MNHNTTLVVGAHGVIGGAVVRRLIAEGRSVATMSRRGSVRLEDGTVVKDHIQVDLLNGAAARACLASRADITDIVYAGYTERDTMAATAPPNVAMLRHVLEAIHTSPSELRHIVLIGGGKSYGEHLGAYKTPAKESDARFLGPIFYNDQEDLVHENAERRGYTWTVLRPDAVIGMSFGSPMNMLTGLAVYAAVCRHLRIPLRFPGTTGAWTALHQATDASLVARAVQWALDLDGARGNVFNVTNGDHFRWQHLWPDIADFFGMETAAPQQMSLTEHMADKTQVWHQVVASHGLKPTQMSDLAAWPFVDAWLSMDADMVQSTIKIRQAGFADCIDSHESFLGNLARMRMQSLIP